MVDLSNEVATVYDYGYSIPLARRLAREYGKVNYFRPWKETEPESRMLSIGTGFPDINRVRHFHDCIRETSIFIFPDIYDADLQNDLISRGKRVWGSRRADRLEYDRPFFNETLESVGLPVVDYELCNGIDELETYLRENDNKWVKVNLRGDDETWHHINWEFSKRRVEMMRHRWGPIGNDIMFTVIDNIDSDIEAAYDGFMVTSPSGKVQFPEIGFLGYENKNLSHILTAIPYDDFPESVREVNDLFAPELAKFYSRSAFGTEVKIVDDTNYFIDATNRQPDPPGPIIMEQVNNLGEFFWHGSEGELIPLEVEEPFGVQVILYSELSKSNWSPIEFPEELDRWVKVSRCCMRDGVQQIVPDRWVTPSADGIERIGSVVAISDSIEGAIDLAKEYCGEIKGMNLTNEVDSLAECLRRIKEGQDEGIEFADDVPEPATVIDNGE